jgi:hypothetical protein
LLAFLSSIITLIIIIMQLLPLTCLVVVLLAPVTQQLRCYRCGVDAKSDPCPQMSTSHSQAYTCADDQPYCTETHYATVFDQSDSHLKITRQVMSRGCARECRTGADTHANMAINLHVLNAHSCCQDDLCNHGEKGFNSPQSRPKTNLRAFIAELDAAIEAAKTTTTSTTKVTTTTATTEKPKLKIATTTAAETTDQETTTTTSGAPKLTTTPTRTTNRPLSSTTAPKDSDEAGANMGAQVAASQCIVAAGLLYCMLKYTQ